MRRFTLSPGFSSGRPSLTPVAMLLLTMCVLAVMCGGSAPAHARPGMAARSAIPVDTRWVWPLTEVRIERPYAAPAHEYGPGHRGVDLSGAIGVPVRAPEAGVIAFSGSIAGRAVVTVDHGDGLVTTLEPVDSEMVVGAAVARAEQIGTIAIGGHASAGALHFGVRLDGRYINPLVLLGGIPRAVLLPCC